MSKENLSINQDGEILYQENRLDPNSLVKGIKKELDTIQKEYKLSTIYSLDYNGPGNAHHVYQIQPTNSHSMKNSQFIYMQKGPRNEEGSITGITNEDLLEIVRDRLKSFQSSEYACEYNEKALEHIEDALTLLNDRVQDRAKRNVLGKYEK